MSTVKNVKTKLVFIHHSCGRYWLNDNHGGLGRELAENGYYVSDTDYKWGPDAIGDHTDIGNWWNWFRSERSEAYWQALMEHDGHADYEHPSVAPSGEHEIVMFKSCYPNNHLQGDSDSEPTPIVDNPLRGQNRYSEHHTIGNAKGIYLDLLHAFEARPEKLFIVVTAPPLVESDYTAQAIAFNRWLVEEWLRDYPHQNVTVFDYFSILADSTGLAKYPTAEGDSHPSPAGNQLATEAFIPFLQTAQEKWRQWLKETRNEDER